MMPGHVCDEFSTYLYSIPMKTKSNSDIVIEFTTMIAYFKQHRFEIHTLHSDHESSVTSSTTKDMYRPSTQDFGQYCQAEYSNSHAILCSIIGVLQQINVMPNSVHPTLTPVIIFHRDKNRRLNATSCTIRTYAALHYAKRVSNKYEPHTDNGTLLYLADSSTANMVAWIPGRHTVHTYKQVYDH